MRPITSGSTVNKNPTRSNPLAAALAALRQTQAAEIAADTTSLAIDYANRRSSVMGQIEAEFACKIAAALMFGLPEVRQSAVATFKREQVAKTNAELARLAAEQRAAQISVLSLTRARHAEARKTLRSLMAPPRPNPRRSARYAELRTPTSK